MGLFPTDSFVAVYGGGIWRCLLGNVSPGHTWMSRCLARSDSSRACHGVKPILTPQEAVKVKPLQSYLAHHMVSTVREQQVRQAPLAFMRDKTDILAPGSPPRVVRSTFIPMDSSILEATTLSVVSI